jgi:hypothetical protein
VANALAYGQTDETPPLHDAVAWRLAATLGEPWRELVAPCVLRDYASEDGSMSLQARGWPGDLAPTLNPTWCLPSAFFDSLIAQQDRHAGNWRWDGRPADAHRPRLCVCPAGRHPQPHRPPRRAAQAPRGCAARGRAPGS